jgi:hypothetical protein
MTQLVSRGLQDDALASCLLGVSCCVFCELERDTDGSCAGQYGSGSFDAQQDLRSWSSPHQGLQSC